jgi:NitT/TauT family transport system substrate-binding protein
MKTFPLFIAGLLCSLAFSAHAQKLEKLVLSGPFASVSNPLIHMAETGALQDFADKVHFQPWNSADQLKLLAMGKADFRADFVAMPSNVAANLYNRGVDLTLLNTSVWGILWMVSRENNLQSLADFKGKEIAVPFRSDMPDIVFEQLLKAHGLDPKEDFKLRYVAHPLDAMQLLILRQVDHALLAEPAISMALRKTQSFPVSVIAPDLYRSVDLQKEWGKLFNRKAEIPQAGMVALRSVKDNPKLLEAFNQAYKESAQWIAENPKEASQMIAKYNDRLTAQAVEDSIAWVNMKVVSAQDAKADLEFLFNKILEHTPAALNQSMPDNDFYYSE